MGESPGMVTVTIPWPHEPEPGCLLNHCHTHCVDEPEDDAYRVCGECGHVFPTTAALLADHNELAARIDLGLATELGQVYTCPHCAHDF